MLLGNISTRVLIAAMAPLVALAATLLITAPAPASAAAPHTLTPQPTFSPAPDTGASEGTRVLVIGDSITGFPGCWRAIMWQDLTNAGHDINMVGTRQVNECGEVTNDAAEPWDPDNSGISGITTAGMYVKIGRDGLMDRTQPQAVVAMLGTNDLLSGLGAAEILEQYDMLVDLIRKRMPEGPIIISAPPPISEEACPGCQAQVDQITAELPAWASAKSTAESPVYAVTHLADFDGAAHNHDGIHPTAEGEEKIAAAMTPVVAQALTDFEASKKASPPWLLLIVPMLVIAAIMVWGLLRRRANTPTPVA